MEIIILSIVVLTSKYIRKLTAAIFLTCLTFSDLCVLYTGLLRQWLICLIDSDIRHLSEAFCKVHIWLVYSSLDFSPGYQFPLLWKELLLFVVRIALTHPVIFRHEHPSILREAFLAMYRYVNVCKCKLISREHLRQILINNFTAVSLGKTNTCI